ncbi:MAG TPA: trypsin-like serine protease [Polyangiales bacterium]|nr:trypsin-like serine protease [Polyangiales bacterium]
MMEELRDVSFGRSAHMMAAALLSVALSGCAPDAGESSELGDEETGEVASQEQAISNGVVVPATSVQTSGVVSLQYWSTSENRFVNHCTGTLLSNTAVITARHCLDDLEARTVTIKMGTERRTVVRRYLHPDKDVAIVKLDSGLPMFNWSYDHYLSNPQQLWTSWYGRSTYSGTNMSLKGATIRCYGYGGSGVFDAPLKRADFKVRVFGNEPAIQPRFMLQLLKTASGQLHQAGDSGGPCMTSGGAMATETLYSVLSGCFNDFCYAHGAEEWRDWAALVMISP